MKLNTFKDIRNLANQMELGIVGKTELIAFSTKGLHTTLDDIFNSDTEELFTVLKDGSVHKTLVYISERPQSYIDRGWALPKFHMFNCTTMKDMRIKKKGDRYHKAAKLDGIFGLNIVQENGTKKYVEEHLKVCKNCLNVYNKYYKDDVKEETFILKEYLNKPMMEWKPLITEEEDMTVIPRFYARNWKQISDAMKKQKNYTCQECYTKLDGDMKQYLHTHHVDANPGNNDQGNLKVVCIGCHAEEHNHGHIKSSPAYIRYDEIMNGVVA